MLRFLSGDVWPGVPSERIKILRVVLHKSPFHIRVPEDLTASGVRVGDHVLSGVAKGLAAAALAPLSVRERFLYWRFVESVAPPANPDSLFGVSDFNDWSVRVRVVCVRACV